MDSPHHERLECVLDGSHRDLWRLQSLGECFPQPDTPSSVRTSTSVAERRFTHPWENANAASADFAARRC
jgi:hypothetical protein